ncbi:MAG TPA: hypothetical protein VFR86_13145 [Burkholderiaceae bacterium]|nr:hypothetical protein [Burkholderiaceae bacterium]
MPATVARFTTKRVNFRGALDLRLNASSAASWERLFGAAPLRATENSTDACRDLRARLTRHAPAGCRGARWHPATFLRKSGTNAPRSRRNDRLVDRLDVRFVYRSRPLEQTPRRIDITARSAGCLKFACGPMNRLPPRCNRSPDGPRMRAASLPIHPHPLWSTYMKAVVKAVLVAGLGLASFSAFAGEIFDTTVSVNNAQNQATGQDSVAEQRIGVAVGNGKILKSSITVTNAFNSATGSKAKAYQDIGVAAGNGKLEKVTVSVNSASNLASGNNSTAIQQIGSAY